MLGCIQLDIAFLELDEETYFTRKATVLHVRTMVSCRFPISLQSIHRMSYSMFSLNPIQSDQILYINLLRRRGFKWFQVASSLTWPRIRHRMARNSGDTRVRGMPAFRRARLWSSSQLRRGLFQFGRFRFVIGVPPSSSISNDGIFHEINYLFWVPPWLWTPPYWPFSINQF